MTAPLARILLRYGIGAVFGAVGPQLATDPDAVAVVSAGLGIGGAAAVEAWWWAARRWGWAR